MPKTIPYASIDATNRLRPIDMDHAAFLAASFEEKGVQTPIVVTPRGDGYKLVEGGHRYAGMGLLGWTELVIGRDAVIKEMDDFDALLAEIDENLIRRELNPLDRALFLAARQQAYVDRAKTLPQGGDRKSLKFKEQIKTPTWGFENSPRFTDDVAERVGLSKTTVDRGLYIAKHLDVASVSAIRGTMVERNQQQLLQLCDLRGEQQVSVAKAISDGKAKTVADARVAIGLEKRVEDDPRVRLWATLIASWDKADARMRKQFLAFVAEKKGGAS